MTEEQKEPINESDNEPASSSRQFENEENKAILGKVKLIGLGVAVVLLGVLYSIFSGSNKAEDIPKRESFSSSATIGKEITDRESKDQDKDKKILSDTKVEITKEPANKNINKESGLDFEKDNELSDFNTLPESNRQLEELQERVDKVVIENTALKERLEDLINNLQAQLTSQETKIEQLEKNYQVAIKKYQTRRFKKKALKAYRKKEVIVPLALVSIDQWGADTYAVVRDEKMKILHELTVDEEILGWRVISINRNRGLVILVNKTGVNKELFLKN